MLMLFCRKRHAADTEIKDVECKAWDERVKRIPKETMRRILPVFVMVFLSALFFGFSAHAFTSVLSPNYNLSDPNFNTLAMRVYNSNSPYIFTQGAYTYNDIRFRL